MLSHILTMDTRKDRIFEDYGRISYGQRVAIRARNKIDSKDFSKFFKAMREDKRFAAFEFADALKKAGRSFQWRYVAQYESVMHGRFMHDGSIDSIAYSLAAAHPALSDKTKIACYPTRADAARGREVVMSAGKFFAAIYPSATNTETQRRAEAYVMHHAPLALFFAKTGDEWARVYCRPRGFTSCMGNAHSGWKSSDLHHPVRLYAHPENDLSLAYITHNGKPDGDTVARAIVNTKKMTHSRVYGDARLVSALHDLGYSDDWDATVKGQVCNAYVHDGSLVAPYIDGNYTSVNWDGHSDTCTIARHGDYECQETSGFASGQDRSECEECGDSYNSEEEGAYSEHHGISVCEHCANTVFVTAYTGRRSHDLVRIDDCVEFNGDWYLDDSDVLSLHNIVRTHDSELADMDDCIYLDYLGEYALTDECVRLHVAHGDDEYALECDTKTITLNGDEKIVHEEYDGKEDEEENEEESNAHC
jgi:hypothetical protein